MGEQGEDKGFKVVDRRSMSDEEREAERKPAEAAAAGAQPPAAGAGDAGGRAAGIGGEGDGTHPPHPGGHAHPRGLHPPGFLDLLQSLQFSAMMHLGMVQEPDGRRSEVDLPAAQDAIDMMAMLKEKTKGNLTAEEGGVLDEGLYVLRMSYLAAMNAGKTQGGGKP